MSKRRLTTDVLLKLRKRMAIHAQRSGHKFADDIANDYVVYLLEGRFKHATVSQAYIDLLREVNGRKGSPGYDKRRSLNNPVGREKVLSFIKDESQGLSQDEVVTLQQALELVVKPRMKFILVRKLEGCTNQEIAIELGCTESYIHQLVDKELDRIYRILSA